MATIDEIKQQAAAVKNATQVGENTAERVGGALAGLADIAEQQDSKLSDLSEKTRPSALTADVFKSTTEIEISFDNVTGKDPKRLADITITIPNIDNRYGFLIWPHGFSVEFRKGKTFTQVPYDYGALYAIFPKNRQIKSVRFECGGLAAGGGIPSSITENEAYAIIAAWYRDTVLFTIGDRHLIGKKQVTTFPYVIMPTALYSVCNKEKTNYSLKVFADHFVYKNSSICLAFSNQNRQKAIYSKYNTYESYINSSVANTTKKIDIATISDTVTARDGTNAKISFKHISTLNAETENKVCRLLCIGDSVTEGYLADNNKPYSTAPCQYWAWVKSLFEIDKINNNNVGFYFESLGNILGTKFVGTSFDINFAGIKENNIKAYACGVGGSITKNWLNEKLNNGIVNPFYDTVNHKFSLKYWVENYRTLTVNSAGIAERCNDLNKGPLVSDVSKTNVCEPTHVLIQLGYNQKYNSDGAGRNEYMNDIKLMINSIKQEYPNVIILLSLPDTAGGYTISKEYVDEGDDIYSIDWTKGSSKSAHDAFAFMNKDLMTLCDENTVFYVPSYFASPCEFGAATREINDFAFYSSNQNIHKLKILSGGLPQLHPNNAAHASWAYQIYSLIKYTLVK